MPTPPALDVSELTFRHEKGAPAQVERVSLTLRAGRTFGILGGNECGKTSLAHVLLGHLAAERGTARVLGVRAEGPAGAPRWLVAVRVLLLALAAVGLALALASPGRLAALLQQRRAWAAGLFLLALELAQRLDALPSLHPDGHRLVRIGGGGDAARETGRAPDALRARGVAYISSEHDAGQKLPAERTVESVIGEHMPLPPGERRAEVLAALRAAGFQMYADSGSPVGGPEDYLARGLKCGELSGGQKHMVYLLSVLASRPQLLIADEMLCGLDIDRQASVLGLLQKLQLGFGMAILYMTVDLTSFELMAHDGAFMHKGRLIEQAPAHELLDAPSRRELKIYLQLSRENEERSRGKNLRVAYLTGRSVFDL